MSANESNDKAEPSKDAKEDGLSKNVIDPRVLEAISYTQKGRRRSPRRIERTASTRSAILNAAAHIIGRYGYSGCAIAKVTSKAKIAHGTFYLYFKSQQELFDELQPYLAQELLEFIGAATRRATTVYELEKLGFEANLKFLKMRPYLYRLISESELHAPIAFQKYYQAVNDGYSRALRRLFPSHSQDRAFAVQLDTVATMLEGARTRLLMRFGLKGKMIVGLPQPVIDAYLTFVSAGIEQLLGGSSVSSNGRERSTPNS